MTPRTVRIDGFAVPADGSDDGALLAAGSVSKAVTALVALMVVHAALATALGGAPVS
jgi:hypothetical protein